MFGHTALAWTFLTRDDRSYGWNAEKNHSFMWRPRKGPYTNDVNQFFGIFGFCSGQWRAWGSYENRGWFFIQFIREPCEESPTFIQNLVVKPSYGNPSFRVNFWRGSSNNFPRTVLYVNIALRVTSFNNILYVLTALAPWTLYVNIAFWVISINNIPCHCKIHGRPVFISLMPYA